MEKGKGIDRVKEATEKIIDMFRTGNIPSAVARTVIARDKSEKPSNYWSLGNQLLMMIAGTFDARGFNQWKGVGRQVKKGAKALYILAPIKQTIKVKDENGPAKEDAITIIKGFKGIPVFRYEDTEGNEINPPSYEPAVLPPLIEVAERYGVTVKYGPFTKNFYGYFKPATKTIMLCTHDVRTFFHELAHAAHNTIKPLKGGQHAGQEIVAETCAAVLCEIYGYECYIYHGYEYIKHYSMDKTSSGIIKEIFRVMNDVQEVLRLILDQPSENKNVENVA